MFKDNKFLTIEPMLDNQVLINYIKDSLGGVVPASYTYPQGRITVLPTAYSDVADGAWYVKAISYVTDNKLMAGKPTTAYTAAFSDVPDGKYYSAAVVWAAANGIAKGTAGKFSPDAAVTREQLASFLYNYASFLKLDVSAKADLSTFKDSAAVSSYAKDALAWCVSAKIVTGTAGSRLQPKAGATRAQFAAMAYRFEQQKSAPTVVNASVASTTRKDVSIPAYVTLPAGYDKTKTYPMISRNRGTRPLPAVSTTAVP